MYKNVINFMTGETVSIKRIADETFIPFDPANTDYQKVLDYYIEEGDSIFELEDNEVVSSTIVEHASRKKFNNQLFAYKKAVDRLSQYLLAEGREELVEYVPSGEQKFNNDTMTLEPVLVERVTPAIEPLPEYMQISEYDSESKQYISVEIRNPLIVKDEEERAAAQAIVDATPQEVKDAAEAE